MYMDDVSTAMKVGDVVLRQDSSNNPIKVEWLEEKNGYDIPLSVLKDNSGRVYLIVIDGIIKKIGGFSGHHIYQPISS